MSEDITSEEVVENKAEASAESAAAEKPAPKSEGSESSSDAPRERRRSYQSGRKDFDYVPNKDDDDDSGPSRSRGRGGRGGRGRGRRIRLAIKEIETLNYKSVDKLKLFISEQGKILPRRVTGLPAKYQRHIARCIKRARVLALLPFTGEARRSR